MEKCKGKSKQQRYPYPSYPCQRNVWKDGFCKTHHPDEKAKRDKERMDKKNELFLSSQKSKETELLPCPFCGQTPTITFSKSRRGQQSEAYIWHNNSVCPVVIKTRIYNSKKSVLINWNRRA